MADDARFTAFCGKGTFQTKVFFAKKFPSKSEHSSREIVSRRS